MPLYLISPFDTDPVASPPAEPMLAARRALVPPDWRCRGANLWVILMKAAAFLGSIYLAVLGLPLLIALLATGGDLRLLFAQLGNLAAHYLAAPEPAQIAFANTLKLAALGIATLAAIWRLPCFLDQVADALAPAHTHPLTPGGEIE